MESTTSRYWHAFVKYVTIFCLTVAFSNTKNFESPGIMRSSVNDSFIFGSKTDVTNSDGDSIISVKRLCKDDNISSFMALTLAISIFEARNAIFWIVGITLGAVGFLSPCKISVASWKYANKLNVFSKTCFSKEFRSKFSCPHLLGASDISFRNWRHFSYILKSEFHRVVLPVGTVNRNSFLK